MKIKTLMWVAVLLALVSLPACASGKGLFGGFFTAKVADEVKVAGVENAKVGSVKAMDKVAEKVAVVDTSKVTTKTETTTTSVGGNLQNDTVLMRDYIAALKENSKQQGRIYERVIILLVSQMGVLVSLLGWAIKSAMKNSDSDDRFKEKMLTLKLGQEKISDKMDLVDTKIDQQAKGNS